jgi:hypothetical protein
MDQKGHKNQYLSTVNFGLNCFIKLTPRSHPTIVSYNAGVVEMYNATSSLVCFENKNILLFFVKTLKPASMLAL